VVATAAAALVATLGFVRWPRSEDVDTRAVVEDYLDAVEREDYQAAAELLVAGPSERSDLDPLAIDEPTAREIAAGLAAYCRAGCIAPTGIGTPEPDGQGRDIVIVTFGEPRGHPLQRSMIVGETDDGRPYVRGLPPAGTGTIP
jgi:hypothetical protein